MREFDLVVIGSGSAGSAAAIACRKAGWSVAVADESPFGGTCALRGCDPKKVLVAAARAVEDASRYAEIGVLDRTPSIDWAALMRFKRTFTDPVPQQREHAFTEAAIVPLHGAARFEDAQRLRIGEETVRAQHVLIASGAKALHVAHGDEILGTSAEFLTLETLPSTLIFIGGGYISFEFAHVAARCGAQVTILHKDAQALNGFDPEVVERLVGFTRDAGIRVELATAVQSVERTATGIAVRAQTNGKDAVFHAAAGILAAGRVADVDDLALDAAKIQRGKRGITVNAYLQSVSAPNVYAAGDSADGGGLPLTPVAALEGEIVAENLLHGNRRSADFAGLASMVYTIPPLGTVGMAEPVALERGIAYEVRSGDMSAWYSTRHGASRGAYYKAVIAKDDGALLGATILGPHAEEQINVLSLAIRAGIKPARIIDTLFAYPTGSSDFEYML